MNDNAKAWIAALRSGEYKQARGQLRDGDGFCCLGVACDLYGKQHDKQWDENWFGVNDAVLPEEVQDWLGLRREDGTYISRNHRPTDLASQNDRGASFERIADIIEFEPKGLFQ